MGMINELAPSDKLTEFWAESAASLGFMELYNEFQLIV